MGAPGDDTTSNIYADHCDDTETPTTEENGESYIGWYYEGAIPSTVVP